MKTVKDLILEKFVQKEIDTISGKIADEISALQNTLAHDIAREEDVDKSDELKRKYKELTDLYINVAVRTTCADVSVDKLASMGIQVDWMIRREVKI